MFKDSDHGNALRRITKFISTDFAAAGWQGLAHSEEHGGQGLPRLVATAFGEMLNAANMAFALCPLLTDGAAEALLTAGSAQQQQQYIGNMLAGKWSGTMQLTESQAGSDLSAVRSTATRQTDGTYRLTGEKIYITYGEHDYTEKYYSHGIGAHTPMPSKG
ncbi:MAG: acyl-CoA dehydrogenase family protein [Agrobacterium sp.]|nr:acyl-CoA dehydrogenase family protein [Agrobacterium sp.]